MDRLKRHADIWLALVVLALAVLVRIDEPRLVVDLRNGVFDSYQRWQPRPYLPSPVRIVDIDDDSLARAGQWPWPRTRVAKLVQRLSEMGAAVIVFDILFAEPDRTSPAQILPLWGGDSGLADLARALPDHDQVLADAVAGANVVTGFVLLNQPTESPPPAAKAGFVHSGDDPRPYLAPFAGAVTSLPALEAAAVGNGALNFIPDADGIIRKVPLLVRLGDDLYPTLAAAALGVAQGAGTFVVKASGASDTAGLGAHRGIAAIRVGRIPVPTDANGRMFVHYTGPVPERYLPAWKVLDGSLPDEAVRGMIAIIGTSAAGLMDLRSTPLEPVAPGVMLHAQIMEQVIHQAWLERPDWANGAEVMFMVVLGAAVILLTSRLGAGPTAAVAGAALAGAGALSWYAYGQAHLLFDPVFPALMVAAVYLVSSLVRHMKAERQRRFVERAFSSYVSPNLVQHFIDHPDELRLGGERRDCSFVLTDLAGFTSLVETSDPARLVAVLNEYIDEMTRIAFTHDGTLDRIVGDAVAVIFSAPVIQPDHARRAVACALAMDDFSESFCRAKRADGVPLGHTRIGVNTGPVIIGNVGGSSHSDYRALGDAINTASRLEGVNKYLGTRICIAATTVAQCDDFIGRPVGTLVLKGKTQGIEAFEPLGRQASSSHRITAYRQAFAKLDRADGEALAEFTGLAERYPDDPLVAFHLARLKSGETGRVVVMAEK
ncbi:MAG TPA: adenylate/guanylate cyclase domain-containing protein [Alphaproteobacteria bacterium]